MFNDLFWALYWIEVLSNLGSGGFLLFIGMVISCFIGLFTIVLLANDSNQPTPSETKRGIKAGTIVFSLFLLIHGVVSFIPSKQTMYMMLGVKMTDNVVNSDLGKKLQQIVDVEVDSYLKKLTPKKD